MQEKLTSESSTASEYDRISTTKSTASEYDRISTTKSNTNEVSNIVTMTEGKNETTSEINDISKMSITAKLNSTSERRVVTTESVIIHTTKYLTTGADVKVNNNIFLSTTLKNKNRNETPLSYAGSTSSSSKYTRHETLSVRYPR